MKTFLKNVSCLVIILFATQISFAATVSSNDTLPSWNDGQIKRDVIQFVQKVTDKNNPQYVPPEQRIATFDNDGTLWVEQPLYTQVVFTLDEAKKLVPQHPEWKTQEPFKSILENPLNITANFRNQEPFLEAVVQGKTIEDFRGMAKQWLATSQHPRFHRPYTELVYQPMLEMMDYLRSNNFKVYIVSGGMQEFIRAFAQNSYNVPINQVIGSTLQTTYEYKAEQPQLYQISKIQIYSDKEGKPEAINLFIGMKPLIAFGNSDGDRQMLEWTQSRPGPHFMALVHHDDAVREYAYGPNSKIGTFSDALMTEAKQQGWAIISMKQDWNIIFPFEKTETH